MGAFVLVGTMAAYGYRALALPSQTTAIHHIVEVPEGLTAQQIGKLLEEARMAKQTDVARLAADAAFVKSLGVEAKTLEGYLFPDTYHFPRRTKPEDVLRAMVHRFKEAYTPELRA